MIFRKILYVFIILCLFCKVTQGHQRSDGLIEDFCDGLSFGEHSLFFVDCKSLQVMFYYDDVEICNPIGSKAKKHKLGMT